ncbi:hypothetical protein W822_20075 [Advenella kashmirensis W13003]|uniref:Uncharacterized protein n=1 Tax=Advenella kashmirensis W13003 TaxID=1424334 RepID=V8QMQ0_9BURK|nr:winged helix-turn-helix transcriptional regulator [Advenella kashmirensis]ETF00942.1 hypothetical protein W822_20075 [Advenella kashmirensis W13003]
MQEKLPGRPAGPIAESVLELLSEKGMLTVRQIADLLLLSLDTAKYTCSRLESRGLIRVVRRERLPGVNKPVAVYATVRRLTLSPAVRMSFPF